MNAEENMAESLAISPEDTAHSLEIEGINVILPVEPYSCQIALMTDVIRSIKDSKNCIVDSPPGSGKTLALLCSALAWQEHEKREISMSQGAAVELEEATPIMIAGQDMDTSSADGETSTSHGAEVELDEATSITIEGQEMDTSPEDGESSTAQGLEERLKNSLNNKRTGPNMNASHEGGLVKKNRSLDNAENSMTNRQGTTNNGPKLITPINARKRAPTIYYGVRTHTQLRQVIKEFKRTEYCGNAKMTLLSSRKKTCIKEFNRREWDSRDEMCIEINKITAAGCEFYVNTPRLTQSLSDAFDVEDLVEAGRTCGACPYYGAKALVNDVDIVFCLHNYLSNPAIRRKIDLEGSVIIIDDAHNIEKSCRESASFDFTYKQVLDAHQELSNLYLPPDYIQPLIDALKGWDDWFTTYVHLIPTAGRREIDWSGSDFARNLSIRKIGYNQFENFKMNCEKFCHELRCGSLHDVRQKTGFFLEGLCTVLEYFFRNKNSCLDDFRPALEAKGPYDPRDKVKTAKNLVLHLYCMNSAILMPTLEVARSIILASSALTIGDQNMNSIDAELGIQLHTKKSIRWEMPKDKMWMGIVTGEKSGINKYTYTDLESSNTCDLFGRLVEQVCKVTPNGVLCFINSYGMLRLLLSRWKDDRIRDNIWSKLQNLKHVFVENNTDDEDQQDSNLEEMKKFTESANTEKGALLLAVYRGKVSEGVDFKDNLARAVICMGIPYPNPLDKAVEAKQFYNNRNKNRTRPLLSGKDWNEVQAYRALIPAMGRCIRHLQDWGAILLVDCRHSLRNLKFYCPEWVQSNVIHDPFYHINLDSRADGLASFMQRMKSNEAMPQ